jgi:hypothetical protein
VLFAFLLVVPFSNRFEEVAGAVKTAYAISLLATLVGTVFLIAPTAYHRLRWRDHNKERMLRICNWLAIAGLVCVAVAMTAAVYLVTEVVVDVTVAVITATVAALLFLVVWLLLPLLQPYRRWDEGVEVTDATTEPQN